MKNRKLVVMTVEFTVSVPADADGSDLCLSLPTDYEGVDVIDARGRVVQSHIIEGHETVLTEVRGADDEAPATWHCQSCLCRGDADDFASTEVPGLMRCPDCGSAEEVFPV